MQCIEDLLELDPFKHLPRERLQWMCDRAESVLLAAGDDLVKEGDRAE
ncbi:MAG: histidine kinase, partial [Leptolyngbyaceae cyanobacterium SL_1_1]|nr:histidine kinase [Leptolyngbyaceae cyanobacterium SL_1_1]